MGEYRYSDGPECFFTEKLNRQIALREFWGGSLKTFVGFLGLSSDLTGLAKDTKKNIQQLKGLVRSQPIDRKRGPIENKILKLLGHGDQQMPGGPSSIGDIRKALWGFALRQKAENSRRRIT